MSKTYKPGERELLEEVALRNAIAQFRASNLASLRVAAVPEIGIFWIDKSGKSYFESTSLRDAEDFGDFKNHEGTHWDAWDDAVRKHPSWKSKEMDEVPRGRVVYRKDPRKPEFIVYMPKQLQKFKSKIISKFKLPMGSTRFDFSDEHYRM